MDYPLETLNRVYPKFLDSLRGRTVCDFGCGAGKQAFAMSLVAEFVVGYDISLKKLVMPIRSNLRFANSLDKLGKFDVIVSQNSMEHYSDPAQTLRTMKRLLNPGGWIYITFGPPWLAPYGAHMAFFTPIPWIHLLMPEAALMRWRSVYRSDGALRYEEVEGGLNKMTVEKFESLVKDLGFEVIYQKYDGLKGLHRLTSVPVLREYFTNHISVILRVR